MIRSCMPQAPLYNSDAKEMGTVDLAEAVFGVHVKSSVVHQVYVALMANAREPWADTKDRGEVRGGGKKPWKQKGTGRARHGSIRSPIWKGGGVTFGPLSVRNYKQKINKKMNQAAVRMCLSDKVAEKKFLVVDALSSDGKTKAMAALRNGLPAAGKTTMFLVGAEYVTAARGTRNIPGVDCVRAVDANVVDLLHHQMIIATKDAIAVLEKRLDVRDKR